MSEAQQRSPRIRATFTGGLLLILGLAGGAAVAAAAYGASDASERWTFQLGLPGVLLLSAAAQIVVVAGVWLIWRARSSR